MCREQAAHRLSHAHHQGSVHIFATMSAPDEDQMGGGDEVIGDDERAPLADEEKVPLSVDGSREDIVAPPSGGGDGQDQPMSGNQDTVVVKKTTIATTTGSQGQCPGLPPLGLNCAVVCARSS